MVLIENETKIALQIIAVDRSKKIFDKGVIYPYQSFKIDLDDIRLLRFMYRECVFRDYEIVGRPERIIVGQSVAKDQIMSSAYFIWIDMPELRIHNLTGCPLLFNGHLMVPPKDVITYKGRDQDGIQTGFNLVNNDGIFQDFNIRKKVTDVYYGLVADHRIPKFTQRYLV